MRPPFCRIGSKKGLAPTIIKMFPEEKTNKYIEVFVGSGAVLFKKQPHPIEVINDFDKSLIDDYKLLLKVKGRNFRQDLDTLPKLQAFYDNFNIDKASDEDKLTYSIISRCNKFGSDPDPRRTKLYKATNPYNKLKNIDEYQDRLKNVKIESKDYKAILKKYDSEDALFFLDPPYEDSKRLYIATIDQEELRDALKSLKGYWLLTINDSDNIRELYKDYNIKSITVKGTGHKGIGTKVRKELIITNY